MKLVPVILLFLAPPIIWLQSEREPHRFKHLLTSLFAVGAFLAFGFVTVDFLVDSGAYLAHFRQSWSSHFGAAKSFEYGSADDHPFDWSVFLKNWDTSIPALLGVILLLRSVRSEPRHVLPLSWLGLSFIIFTSHRPWWPYYYIHIAIPLCWCAAIGIVSLVRWTLLRRHWALSAALGICGLASAGWMSGRLYLQITEIRRAPQTYRTPVLEQLQRFKPSAQWVYADQPIFSFYAGIPMPPPLAVVPLKRMWAGDMTNTKIAQEMAHYKPGLILLANDGRLLPFEQLLNAEYRMVYLDEAYRLYAHKSIAKQPVAH